MEQIIIQKANGERVAIESRGSLTRITKAEQKVALLGEDVVALSVESAAPRNFDLGDRIEVFGRVYSLNMLPVVKKKGSRQYSYELSFEGVQYELARAQYEVTIDTTGAEAYGDALMGDLRRFMEVLVENANRIAPGTWCLGEVPETDTRNLMFNCENCLAVLQRLCQEFEQEFDIVQQVGDDGRCVKTIHIRKAGQCFPYQFQYGRGMGLYELTRGNVSSANIVTRLKIFGASKNLGSKYRNDRLCLAGRSKSKSYLEDADAMGQYGVWEATRNFEEVYPQRTGRVTAKGASYLQFVDESMFDLNELEADGKTTKYKIGDVAPKVHFNTGGLAGYQFDTAYDHAKRMFTLKKFTDDRNVEFPAKDSEAFQVRVADEYVLLDINMPDSYISEAEARLEHEGRAWLEQNSQPKVQYGLSVDDRFLAKMAGEGSVANVFMVGDYIEIKDVELCVDKSIRVSAFTRDLMRPYAYGLTISDTVERSTYSRVVSQLLDVDRIIKMNDLADPAVARRKWLDGQEVLGMVFDPEGDYYTERIKPGSIETQSLSVGAKSMQFMLQNTLIEANYGGDANVVRVTGGILTHWYIEDVIRDWELGSGTSMLLEPGAYYIYAKCEQEGGAGTVVFSTKQVKVTDEPNFYHFWIGVVHSVLDDVRAISLTYGSTTVNGKFIRTGQIESSDGSCFMNLDGGAFRIGNKQSSLDWNSQNDGTLRLRGTLVQSPSGEVSALGVFRGSYSGFVLYYEGDEVTYNGSTYRCMKDFNSAECGVQSGESLPEEYWKMTAAKGTDGADGRDGAQGPQGVQGAKGADGLATYTWIRYADNATGGGMSNLPDGKQYIGFAYNKTTATESNTATDYKWALIKGPQGNTGVAGPAGANGQPTYTWIKYADVADGTGLYDVPTAATKYIGIAVNKLTAAESAVKTDYTWSLFKGDKGDPGVQKNLFRTSGQFGTLVKNWANNGGGLTIDTVVKFNGFNTLKTTVGTGIVGDWYALENGQEYTYSALIRSTENYNGSGNVPLHFWTGLNNTNQSKVQIIKSDISFIANQWKLAYIVFKLTSDANSFRPFIYVGSGARVFNIAYLKLEKGDKPTDWIPNFDDLDDEIALAQDSAKKANDALGEFSSDNKLTAVEKLSVKLEWDTIVGEKTRIEASADTYGVSKTAYQTAYNALSAYVTPLLANLAVTSDIMGTTFRSFFVNYYNARQDLLNGVSKGAKDYANAVVDGIQVGGRNLIRMASIGGSIDVGPFNDSTGRYSLRTANSNWRIQGWTRCVPGKHSLSFWAKAAASGQIVVDTSDQNSTTFNITTSWAYYKLENISITQYLSSPYYGFIDIYVPTGSGIAGQNLYIANLMLEHGCKCSSHSFAPEDVDASIAATQKSVDTLVLDISSDNVLIPSEKTQLNIEWLRIQKDHAAMLASAARLSISSSTLVAAYNTLSGYITPLLSNLGVNSAVTGSTLRSYISAWYDAYANLNKTVMVADSDNRQVVVIDTTGLDQNTWYPVLITCPTTKVSEIHVYRSLSQDAARPVWGTHGGGFSLAVQWTTRGSGWGAIAVERVVQNATYGFATGVPVGSIGQLINSSNEYIYVRGGAYYYFNTVNTGGVTLVKASYTVSSQTIAPITAAPEFPSTSLNEAYKVKMYQGDFAAGKPYRNNAVRQDVVKYSNAYYMYKGADNQIQTSWVAGNWVGFGASFESVATNLLLAESATIADWTIKGGKISSQLTTADGSTRAVLDGKNGAISFASDVSSFTPTGGPKNLKQTISIESGTGKIETRSIESVAYLSSEGIFANKAGIQAVPASSGLELKAAVAALGFGNLQKDAYFNSGAICGLYASAYNSNSNPAPAWGAIINVLQANGLHVNTRRITSNTYLSQTDVFVACYNQVGITVYLPSKPYLGQFIMIRRINGYDVVIQGNGISISQQNSGSSTSLTMGGGWGSTVHGSIGLLIYDGQYWNWSYMVK